MEAGFFLEEHSQVLIKLTSSKVHACAFFQSTVCQFLRFDQAQVPKEIQTHDIYLHRFFPIQHELEEFLLLVIVNWNIDVGELSLA